MCIAVAFYLPRQSSNECSFNLSTHDRGRGVAFARHVARRRGTGAGEGEERARGERGRERREGEDEGGSTVIRSWESWYGG
jgi:hypothetical protein